MTEPSPSPQHRPPARLNVLNLEPGTRLRLVGEITAEVVTNPRDGLWVMVRYLDVPNEPQRVGSEEMIFAEDILDTL